MQATPDKDFNQAFQDKFDLFEIQPSAAVWKGIVANLDEGKKKPFPFFKLMAAASVVVLIGAGLWLFSPKERVRLHGRAEEQLGFQNEDPSQDLPKLEEGPKALPVRSKTIIEAPETKVNSVSGSSTEVQAPIVAAVQEVSKPVEKVQPAKEIELTRQDDKALKEKAATAIPMTALALSSMPIEPAADTNRYMTSRRNKSGAGLLGSVVNYVVGKVDPREDKLIKFSGDDDGGSEISGINLMIIKLKKQNKQ